MYVFRCGQVTARTWRTKWETHVEISFASNTMLDAWVDKWTSGLYDSQLFRQTCQFSFYCFSSTAPQALVLADGRVSAPRSLKTNHENSRIRYAKSIRYANALKYRLHVYLAPNLLILSATFTKLASSIWISITPVRESIRRLVETL